MEESEIKDLDLGTLSGIGVDNKEFIEALTEVSNVDDFRDYLVETMACDIKRFFFASPESQERIKGAYQRTKYLYDLLKKISGDKIKNLT